MLEAIALCEEIAEQKLNWSYSETNRSGDHIWWISDLRKFKQHYPDWKQKHDVQSILNDIFAKNVNRWEPVLG